MVQSRGASRASSYLTPETEKEENPDYYCVFPSSVDSSTFDVTMIRDGITDECRISTTSNMRAIDFSLSSIEMIVFSNQCDYLIIYFVQSLKIYL